MIDELDLSAEFDGFYRDRTATVVKNLERRSMNAQYVPSRAEALAAVMQMIPQGVKVVRGDSLTLDQIGVLPALKERNKNAITDPFERLPDGHFTPDVEKNRFEMMREAFTADVFLAGTNAVTLDGKLVNTDGGGNRVAPMIFGPKKVILVAGVNKIVKDLDAALERIHNLCAPVNARRHALKHHRPGMAELPCARTGRCVDCTHEWRICSSTVIIDGSFRNKGRINVVLVGEALGI